MKLSQLRQLIKEEISKTLDENKSKLKGKQVDPKVKTFTYDHLLPKGTGDDFTFKQFNMMMDAAKEDAKILKAQNKKVKIGKDDMDFPYLDIL